MRTLAIVAALVLLAPAGCASETPDEERALVLSDLGPQELDERIALDAHLLRSYSNGARRTEAAIEKSAAVFDRASDQPLTPDERRAALEIFEQVLAWSIAFDGLASFHGDFWRVDVVNQNDRHARCFAIGFGAYCAQIRLGLAFIHKTLGKPQFETLLEEGSKEAGVPSGAYSKLKWNVVHIEELGRIFALGKYHTILDITAYDPAKKDPELRAVLKQIDEDYDEAIKRLAISGARLFAGNALDILRRTGHRAWFPIQMTVAEWMGHTRVRRLHGSLISREQIDEAARRTYPGDIVIERRNWFLSNIGLPGFWPHATLWLGSPDELANFLDRDPDVARAYGGPFTAALKARFPDAWARYASLDDETRTPHRLIEAVSKGVIFSSAEHSLAADYAACMRPRLSKLEVARAIERAFGYAGRPYDFDFDFYSDATLVCSELVWKAYEPRAGVRGLKIALVSIVGRMTLPPNTIVAQFDRELGKKEQQLDFGWFLDGSEANERAEWGDVESFRASHGRVKWDILQK